MLELKLAKLMDQVVASGREEAGGEAAAAMAPGTKAVAAAAGRRVHQVDAGPWTVRRRGVAAG